MSQRVAAKVSKASPRTIPVPVPGELSPEEIIEAFAYRMMYSVAKDTYTATDFDIFQGLSYAVRDRLMDRWFRTQSRYYTHDVKRVYYLSLEFLMGRALVNNILNLKSLGAYGEALASLGLNLEELAEKESDAGLGNGGLGRLAACFLDSAATLGIPFYGYGIRYEYGIFRQFIHEGEQFEAPDNWLRYGTPWEIPRPDALFPVEFFGRVQSFRDPDGSERFDWVDAERIYAMAYDVPVAGYGTNTVNTLRLWAAKSTRDFDLTQFNSGQYLNAVEHKSQTENISKVLYPPDTQYAGKELRLKQQYFFVSATLQDVIRRFRKKEGRSWDEFPDKVAIQLNDTHPAIAIPELMRVFLDRERLSWDYAWELTRTVFSFTNHTVLPEALETWPVEFLARLLPRHLTIIEEIDRRHRADVAARYPNEEARVTSTAVIDHSAGVRVRMANLAIVGSRRVNGVAALHTEILSRVVFRDFNEMFPDKFINQTNGITPRRWLLKANRGLASLISGAIGDGWITDLPQLERLRPLADDSGFRKEWVAIKNTNKEAFVKWCSSVHKIDVDPSSMFDIQVKRIHEYKRQLLNVLHVITLYHRLIDGEDLPFPRTVLFAGKSAPSYVTAKRIIRLIHEVSAMIEADERARRQLKVVFMPNYGVSCAERIFPACDLSEQISTAGTEASGTGNMKAAVNGALTIGTLDGANVEIMEEVGEENIFIFGLRADQVAALKQKGYVPSEFIAGDPLLARVLETIATGPIEARAPGVFRDLLDILKIHDPYFHCADFRAYIETQERAAATYLDREKWTRMAILNVAGMGKFSSDRTVSGYARDIWRAESLQID